MQQPAPGPCICYRVRRASRALTRWYDDALAGTGFSVTQFSILNIADRLKGPTLARLAEATGHERSALWRTLQPLIREGYVTMEDTGARSQAVMLTDRGRAAVKAAAPHWRKAQSKVRLRLGERRERALLALLSEIETLAN